MLSAKVGKILKSAPIIIKNIFTKPLKFSIEPINKFLYTDKKRIIPLINVTINKLTGYETVQQHKNKVTRKDYEQGEFKQKLNKEKQEYHTLIEQRRKCQIEINQLLQVCF